MAEFEGQVPEENPSVVEGGQAEDSPTDNVGGDGGADPSTEPQPDSQPDNRDSDFARMRRSMKEQYEGSAEYKLAQQLASQYNMTPDQMLQRIEQQRQQQEAEKAGVDPQFYQQHEQLKQQVRQMQEQQIQQTLESQVQQLQQSNPNITDQDLSQALEFLGKAHRLGEESMTLEQAFRATNPNYENTVREQERQRLLQEMQGGNNPLPPQGGTPDQTSKSAFDLNSDEFAKLNERIKAGERITGY